METKEALTEAQKFLEEHPAGGFTSTEALVAAAILQGEHLGAQRVRAEALRLMRDASSRLFA